MFPIDALRTAVTSYEPYLQALGEMLDLVFAEPTAPSITSWTCPMVTRTGGDSADSFAWIWPTSQKGFTIMWRSRPEAAVLFLKG